MPSEPKLADNVQLCIIPYWRFFTSVVLFFDVFKEKHIRFRVFPKVLNPHQRTGWFQASQKQQNQKNRWFQVFSNPSKNHRFSWFRNPPVLSRFFPGSLTLNFFFQAGSRFGYHGKLICRVRFQGRRRFHGIGTACHIYLYICFENWKRTGTSEQTTQHSFLLQSKIDRNSDQFGW